MPAQDGKAREKAAIAATMNPLFMISPESLGFAPNARPASCRLLNGIIRPATAKGATAHAAAPLDGHGSWPGGEQEGATQRGKMRFRSGIHSRSLPGEKTKWGPCRRMIASPGHIEGPDRLQGKAAPMGTALLRTNGVPRGGSARFGRAAAGQAEAGQSQPGQGDCDGFGQRGRRREGGLKLRVACLCVPKVNATGIGNFRDVDAVGGRVKLGKVQS